MHTHTSSKAISIEEARWRIAHPQPVPPEELARRRALAEEMRKLREEAVITPLTTADLVHMSRDDKFWYPDGDGS